MKKTLIAVLPVLLVVGAVASIDIDTETGEWSFVAPWSRQDVEQQNDAMRQLLAREDATDVVARMEELVQNGAQIDATNSIGYQPLHFAAIGGHSDAAAWLLENGADISAQNTDGMQPLHDAASNGHLDVVRLLVESGADVSARASGDTQPIHYAAMADSRPVITLLLEAGANASARTESGTTPHGFTDNEATRKLLVAAGGERAPVSLFEATQLGKQLSQLWLTADGPEDLDRTARKLLEAGAKPDIRSSEGMQAVHFMTHNADIMRLLLEKGAAATATDGEGLQPLHIAAEAGEFDTVRLLLDNGADPKAKTRDGKTAVDLASSEQVRALLK